MANDIKQVEKVLRWRGLAIHRVAGVENVILPKTADADLNAVFFRFLAHYSFRLLLQDILKAGATFTSQQLCRYVSPQKTAFYIDLLLKCGIITQDGPDAYRFQYPHISTFGPTLQWYVSEVLKRKFAMHAICNVEVNGLNVGGDFDILATLSHYLLCVETKASPPKNIHQPSIDAFIRRKYALGADMAVLLTDTHLRMEDKINKMVKWALEKYGRSQQKLYKITRLSRGVFYAGENIYILNSRPTIHQNIQIALRYFFDMHADA